MSADDIINKLNIDDDEEEFLNSSSSSKLDSDFNYAVDQVRQNSSKLDQSSLLYLYGRYKIVTDGPCNTPKPGLFDLKGKQKWESWKGLGTLNPEQAKTEYVRLVFEKLNLNSDNNIKTKETSSKSAFGQAVSKFAMVSDEENFSEDVLDRNVEDWLTVVKNDDLKNCKLKFSENPTVLTAVDHQGLTALHWAADRCSSKVMHWLLEDVHVDVSFINCKDFDGQTALHYASSCDNVDVASMLIRAGADFRALDNDGNSPYDVAISSDMKKVLSGLMKN